jgi:hypothetical protein
MHESRKRIVIVLAFMIVNINVCSAVISMTTAPQARKDEMKSQPCGSFADDTQYYAVICACSAYEDPKHNIPRGFLGPAPEAKLRVLYDALIQTGNWDAENIILLLNKNASKQNITFALERMSTLVGPDDVFLFTWNGHGSLVPDIDGDEAYWDSSDTYDEVICPYDTNRVEKNLTNVLTDDDLQQLFSQINAKGKCFIFESCLSGGLIDQDSTIASKRQQSRLLQDRAVGETGVMRDSHSYGNLDVNGNNTIVITSTLPTTLGRATFTTHSPLLYSIAKVLAHGERYDKNKDSVLSAEELFRSSQPRALLQSSLLWVSLWISMVLFFKLDMYNVYSTIVPNFLPRLITFYYLVDKVVPLAVFSGTLFFLLFYLDQQLLVHLLDDHFLMNWPGIQDEYAGELPLVQLK